MCVCTYNIKERKKERKNGLFSDKERKKLSEERKNESWDCGLPHRKRNEKKADQVSSQQSLQQVDFRKKERTNHVICSLLHRKRKESRQVCSRNTRMARQLQKERKKERKKER